MSINAIGTPQVDIFSNYKNGFANTSGKAVNTSKHAETSRNIGKPIEELSSKDFIKNDIENKKDIKYGLLGDEGCDIIYIPKQILATMPKIPDVKVTLADVANGNISDISSIPMHERGIMPSVNPSSMLSQYKKVLNDFGIDYNDQESMTKFFNDSTLMEAVNAKFDKIV